MPRNTLWLKDRDETPLNTMRNLPVNRGIISAKKDVRVVSSQRSPAIFEDSLPRFRAKTSISEDAFERRNEEVGFRMKLRGHKKYLREICEKVDQDLSSPTCKKLREHFPSCPFCSAYYDSLKETILLYRKYDEKLKGSQVKKILAHIQLSETADLQRTRKDRPKRK